MRVLKLIFCLISILTFGQLTAQNDSLSLASQDFSDSRFDIDGNGFHGKTKTDTTYYVPGHKIASIKSYAVDKKSIMSGNKAGLSTEYYPNGQIRFQGYYQMYSLRYCCSPKHKRLENSYKIGLWTYYYETGQIMATGEYQIKDFEAPTGIDDQIGKKAIVSDSWKFYNIDGNISSNKEKIIEEIEYNSNCD